MGKIRFSCALIFLILFQFVYAEKETTPHGHANFTWWGWVNACIQRKKTFNIRIYHYISNDAYMWMKKIHTRIMKLDCVCVFCECVCVRFIFCFKRKPKILICSNYIEFLSNFNWKKWAFKMKWSNWNRSKTGTVSLLWLVVHFQVDSNY